MRSPVAIGLARPDVESPRRCRDAATPVLEWDGSERGVMGGVAQAREVWPDTLANVAPPRLGPDGAKFDARPRLAARTPRSRGPSRNRHARSRMPVPDLAPRGVALSLHDVERSSKAPLDIRLLARGAKTFGKVVSASTANLHRVGLLPGDADVEIVRDIPYARRGGKQSFDLYLPRTRARAGRMPYAVFVHGGGFVIGDRKMGALMGRRLASRGIRPRAAVGFYGAYDLGVYLRPDSRVLDAFLRTVAGGGDVDALVRAHHALGALPFTDVPVLLVHGSADRFVPVQSSIALARSLERQGVPVELTIYPGAGHGFNYQTLFRPEHTAASFLELERFLTRHVLTPPEVP